MMPAYGGGASCVQNRTCGMYWCYQCDRALRIISYPASDVFCPRCFGRFLHEIDPPPRTALPPPGFYPRHFIPARYDGHQRQRQWVVHSAGGPAAPGGAFGETSHVPAPRRRLPSPPPPSVSRRPSMPPSNYQEDYFTGTDLNSLVEELTQNDRHGPAPAPASAIDALPTVRITDAHLSDGSQCPVCKEDFELGEAARQLPCKHVYHSDCIVPWLRLHNSCPVCRSQLPGAASTTTARHARRGSTGGNMDRDREPPTIARWGPLSWMWPPRGMEEPDDEWEYRRRGRRPEEGAGGNDLSALQSFVLAATCVFFFSFFV